MAYQVLARKYRSRTFDEVVGQTHVAQTLKKAIASGRIAHAYLFSGTRGVGKTSMARILAKALNCRKSDGPTAEPCLKCDSCEAIARGEDMDVIEIDAASNTQVDRTREVILENSQYRPARSRFKIYIIDEVHMLSKASFNALLKTLEEPPEHVKFILATTEPEKILPTILSRCQRYDFRNIPTREIAAHLKSVCKDEKIKADEDALILVAKAGAGSMRDGLSLLDRLLSVGDKHLTVENVEELLGLPHGQRIFDLVQAIGEGRVKDVLAAADKLTSEGLSTDSLLASLIDHLRNLLVIRTCGADSALVEAATLSLDDLSNQAQRFEPVVLTEDITILEDLRRQLRQTQAGRALLDATLVRLALADQFMSISELLGRVDGAPAGAAGAAAQKKKSEPVGTGSVGCHARTGASVADIAHSSDRPREHASSQSGSMLAPAAADASRESDGAAAGVSMAPENTANADDDDDLPRPGKVWEGPKLSEILKQSAPAAAPKPESPAPAPEVNVEPADPNDLNAVWSRLLEVMRQHGMGVYSLLVHGQLAGFEENQAVIRYGADHETFPKMLARNGKREMIIDALSSVLGKPTGVKFVLEDLPEGSATGGSSASAIQPAAGPQQQRPVARADKPPVAQEPAAAVQAPRPKSIAVTPQQLQEFERDPLIGALLSKLGATIVKISEDV